MYLYFDYFHYYCFEIVDLGLDGVEQVTTCVEKLPHKQNIQHAYIKFLWFCQRVLFISMTRTTSHFGIPSA